MSAITIRPATATDIAEFYGGARRETVQAVMVIKAGAAVGIIGLKHEPGRLILFADQRPELGEAVRSFAVRRAVLEMVRQALRSRLPLFSVKAPESDVLPRLGFEHVCGDLYRWPS
jgi:hypothetical protein